MKLGVNIDHVATLREVRGSKFPNIIEAAEACFNAGAHQITVHLREDRRHIQDRDIMDLIQWGKLPINMEMALTEEMVRLARKWKPACVTLVPEKRAEMTTESGLNLEKWTSGRRKLFDLLRSKLACVAFIDPSLKMVNLSSDFGFSGVEFHTGPYAHGRRGEIERLRKSSRRAHEKGLEVKAGHGLTVEHIRELHTVPHLEELNIGHSIVCRSVFVGLEAAVREILDQFV